MAKKDEKAKGNGTADKLARLDAASEILGVPFVLEETVHRMKADIFGIMKNYVDLGRCALAVKAGCGHGDFEKIMRKEFEDPGILTLRSIQNAMRVAEFAAIKGSSLPGYGDLGKIKQLMIASASDDDIGDGTVFGLTMDEVKAMNVRDLQRQIKKLEGENRQLDEQLVSAQETIDQGREQLMDYRDKSRLVGVDDKRSQEVLDQHLQTIQGTFMRVMKDLDPKKMSPNLKAQLKGFFGACDALVDEYSTQFFSIVRQ